MAVSVQIEESLFCQSKGYSYRIKLSNSIILDREKNKGGKRLHYKIQIWRVKGGFDILNDINENATSVQLMDTVVNLNHLVITVIYWIFDSNDKKITSIDNVIIEYHILSLVRGRSFCHF